MRFKRILTDEQLDWLYNYAKNKYGFIPSSPKEARKVYLILANNLNLGYCIPYKK